LIDKKIKASKGQLEFNNGVYILDPRAVNRFSVDGKTKRGAEIFFFEGNPSPVQLEKPKDDPNAIDPSAAYLDNVIYINFLKQTGHPTKNTVRNALAFLSPLTDPTTLFKLIFFITIIAAFLRTQIMNLLNTMGNSAVV
jgi:hypothetical protein